MQRTRRLLYLSCTALWSVLTLAAPPTSAAPDEVGASSAPVVETAAEAGQLLSLGQCLDVALRMSHRRPVSRFSLLLAEAQHRQALAGYWPQVTAKPGWSA